MSADKEFISYLQQNLYHPRSSAHGDKLCQLLLADLLSTCQAFKQAAKERRIVYKLNHVIGRGSPTQWNLDLVVGPPSGSVQRSFDVEEPLLAGEPETIWIAVDAKTIMTEHGKARRNRQRDLNSLHDILHRKNPEAVVAGLLVLNIADKFRSPLRTDMTLHRNITKLVRETILLFEGLPMSGRGSAGLDALGIIVVAHTNVKGDQTRLITGEPAPQPGSSVHYETFLTNICKEFTRRFSA